MKNKYQEIWQVIKAPAIFLVVLLVASFLRLYNIPNTVQFLGDQGRDAMIVANIFKKHDLVFIGPVTSVGNMYLGPLYYYFMVPFLWFTYPSPMGPVYVIALLGIFTVYLMYLLGKTFLSERVALISATLFGLSTVVASQTRFSWNPNPAPLVSLLMLYFVSKALKKSVYYWIWVFVCFSVLIQLHYLTLLSAGGFGLIWIYQVVKYRKDTKLIKEMLVSTMLGIFIFLVSLTPLFLFDYKHDGLNRKAFINILANEQSFVDESIQGANSLGKFILDSKSRTELLLSRVALGRVSDQYNLLASLTILIILTSVLVKKYRAKQSFTGELIVLSFILTGIVGTAVYKHDIYLHYIAYLFPAIFFATGITLDYLFRQKLIIKLLALSYLLLFVWFNLNNAKVILHSTGWTIANIQSVAKTIEDRVTVGEKYNLVLLTGTGDIEGQNYRYFLTTSEKPPVTIENNDEVDTLFIINEDKVLKKVTDSPIYEVVVFPNKEPSEVYQIENGPEITVLRRK